MTKFISLHLPDGKELKFRADLIIGLHEMDAEGPSGQRALITLLITPYTQIPCRESIEQVEALMESVEFTP